MGKVLVACLPVKLFASVLTASVLLSSPARAFEGGPAAQARGGSTPPAAAAPQDPSASQSRWSLPAPHLAMRSAIVGGDSRMEQVLVAQRSVRPRSEGAASARPGQPDLFGSIALPVSRTPLDAQWRRASRALPLGRWTRELAGPAGASREALLRRVNAWVNRQVAFADDRRNFGKADHWAGAAETLERGRGDCEDYALTKMQLLAALGFDPGDLYLVLARDTVRQGDHAMLAVRLAGKLLVLDNRTDALGDGAAMLSYRPVFTFSPAGRWVHGYPVGESGEVEIAAAGAGVELSAF